MKLSDYVTKNENGELVFNEELFTADLDRERNNASTTASSNTEKKIRASVEKEIREKIEQEAAMTAEQKLAQEREEFLKAKKDFTTERIKTLYKAENLFDDAEIESFLPLIGEDYDKSVEVATKIIDSRKKRNAEYEKQINEKFQTNLPKPNGGNGGGGNDSLAVRKAKQYATSSEANIVEL